MIFAKKIEEAYRARLFVRYDDTKTAHYFSADDFEGLIREPYTFKSRSGETLKGAFYSYPDPIPGRLVIFEHGMGGGHRSYMREIEMLAREGYLVLSYDHTGCMESGGKSCGGFSQSLSDLHACLCALSEDEKYKALGISVVGHSWGAFAALNISALCPRVSHIVAMAGFVSVRDMIAQNFRGPLALFRNHILNIEKQSNPNYCTYNAADTLSDTNAQVLVIHSTDDATVSCKHHFEPLKQALSGKDNIRFLAVHGKNHNPNYTADAVGYLGEYISSLTEKLKSGALSDDDSRAAFVASFDWKRMTEQDGAVWSEIFDTLKK